MDTGFQLPAAPMKTENADYAVFVLGRGEAVVDPEPVSTASLPRCVARGVMTIGGVTPPSRGITSAS